MKHAFYLPLFIFSLLLLPAKAKGGGRDTIDYTLLQTPEEKREFIKQKQEEVSKYCTQGDDLSPVDFLFPLEFKGENFMVTYHCCCGCDPKNPVFWLDFRDPPREGRDSMRDPPFFETWLMKLYAETLRLYKSMIPEDLGKLQKGHMMLTIWNNMEGEIQIIRCSFLDKDGWWENIPDSLFFDFLVQVKNIKVKTFLKESQSHRYDKNKLDINAFYIPPLTDYPDYILEDPRYSQ